eukprot:421186-Prymnesium_polylepis.2
MMYRGHKAYNQELAAGQVVVVEPVACKWSFPMHCQPEDKRSDCCTEGSTRNARSPSATAHAACASGARAPPLELLVARCGRKPNPAAVCGKKASVRCSSLIVWRAATQEAGRQRAPDVRGVRTRTRHTPPRAQDRGPGETGSPHGVERPHPAPSQARHDATNGTSSLDRWGCAPAAREPRAARHP